MTLITCAQAVHAFYIVGTAGKCTTILLNTQTYDYVLNDVRRWYLICASDNDNTTVTERVSECIYVLLDT